MEKIPFAIIPLIFVIVFTVILQFFSGVNFADAPFVPLLLVFAGVIEFVILFWNYSTFIGKKLQRKLCQMGILVKRKRLFGSNNSTMYNV